MKAHANAAMKEKLAPPDESDCLRKLSDDELRDLLASRPNIEIVVHSDRMSPTLLRDDQVVVDLRVRNIDHDGIYRLDSPFELDFFVRAKLRKTGIRFEFDNPRHGAFFVKFAQMHLHRVNGEAIMIKRMLYGQTAAVLKKPQMRKAAQPAQDARQ